MRNCTFYPHRYGKYGNGESSKSLQPPVFVLAERVFLTQRGGHRRLASVACCGHSTTWGLLSTRTVLMQNGLIVGLQDLVPRTGIILFQIKLLSSRCCGGEGAWVAGKVKRGGIGKTMIGVQNVNTAGIPYFTCDGKLHWR